MERTAMAPAKQKFSSKKVKSWNELIKTIKHLKGRHWLYRGQAHDWPLQSSLERHVNSWDIDPNHAPTLETALAREFCRRVGTTD
jgi:hypothetical protein